MNFSDIINSVKNCKKKKIVIAAAEDEAILEAVFSAVQIGLVTPILVGDKKKILSISSERGYDYKEVEVINATSDVESAKISVQMIRQGEGDILMKGLLQSHILMKAILNNEWGIKLDGILSHVGIIDSELYNRLIFVTDGGMVMYPDLKQKVNIINNVVNLAHNIGVEIPKVACICAIETVNPDMPATLDASILSLMNQRGQIKDCIVDGPLALDNAISVEAAEHKGVKTPVSVAGHADILLVPNIEVGNVILKASRNFGNCKTTGLLVGASVPVVMSSRADTPENKLYAIACAAKSAKI